MRLFHLFLILGLVCSSQFSNAQNFFLVDSTVFIKKSIAQNPAHQYVEIGSNLDTLDTLQWTAHFVNVPFSWQVLFDDQTQQETNVFNGQTEKFVLDTFVEFGQKLIIGIFNNKQPGRSEIIFDIVDPDDSLQAVQAVFDICIGDTCINQGGNNGGGGNPTTSIYQPTNDIKVFPNPTTGAIHLEHSNKIAFVQLFNEGGQYLKNFEADENIDLSTLPNGRYKLRCITEQSEFQWHTIIKME